jgi:hypothetical protein
LREQELESRWAGSVMTLIIQLQRAVRAESCIAAGAEPALCPAPTREWHTLPLPPALSAPVPEVAGQTCSLRIDRKTPKHH